MKSPKTGNLPNQAAFSVRSLGQLGALTGLVYSTDTARMCPDCRQPVEQCICKQAMPPLPTGPVRVSRETKGRGGKSVTVVRGLPLGADALAIIGKQLRAACGSGGTEKDGTLEIQGDHVEKILAFLAKVGHAAKRAG